MDEQIWRDAYRRAAEVAPVRVDRRMRDILAGDVPTFMELPYARKRADLEGIGAAFLGMGYEGVKIDSPHTFLPDLAAPAGPDSIYYRTGADRAPEAVRRYSIHYSIHHGYGLFVEYAPDFYIFKHLRAVDAGDVEVIPGDAETAFERCEDRVREIVGAGGVPLVCGGDHAVTLPVVRAVAGSMPGRLGLIHFDTHYDLAWDPPLFAGSQWAQILGLPNVDVQNFCQIGIRGLRQVPFEGAQVLDRYSYRIRVDGRYPQFQYWLAMPFFSPMPWEVEALYNQPGMKQNNITLDWYPVGTGAYMLTENNPNMRMVMVRNPNFHGEAYPSEGMPEDTAAGLLADAGKPLPFVDRAVYSLDKESIPYWNKFLQGFYDSSGISSDAFDQAIQFDAGGEAGLTDDMREKGIELVTAVDTSIWYMGFNMVDPLLGGDSERARLLRQAISIAVDFGEYISIFANGRGLEAQGAIPPGIFGHREGREGMNPQVFDWHNGRPVRKGIDQARALLAEAGYRDGRDPETGRPLTIYYEAMDAGPDGKARLNWMRKQFAKLGIELVVRATDYNRFQEKMREGTGQVFMWGWNADYPDPENFFFLLYGPNKKIDGGENAANYQNPEFDALFEQMKNMDDGSERQQIIDRMNEILRFDAPWSFGFYPKSFSLHHQWLGNVKPNLMANNTLKYRSLEPDIREQLREQWNPPVLWPIGALLLVLAVGALPAIVIARRRERSRAL